MTNRCSLKLMRRERFFRLDEEGYLNSGDRQYRDVTPNILLTATWEQNLAKWLVKFETKDSGVFYARIDPSFVRIQQYL